MAKWMFSYKEIMEDFHKRIIGKLQPTQMLMGPETYDQFHYWVGSLSHGGLPMMHSDGGIDFNGVSAKVSQHVAEGVIVLVGGASVIKLEASE